MNAQFTRSIAIALALTLGAASATTAFAAVRNGPSGPSGPSSSGPSGAPSHSSNAVILQDVQTNCDGEIRCITPPLKKPIVRVHYNCDNSRVYWDGSTYKDCRHQQLDYSQF